MPNRPSFPQRPRGPRRERTNQNPRSRAARARRPGDARPDSAPRLRLKLDDDAPSGNVRLQRLMADAGVAARRVCETMIEDGRVEVNGAIVARLPVFVDPETDRVTVDGRDLRKPERRVYIMLHKPRRTLSSTADQDGFDRATIMELVKHPSNPRLFPVGRLDWETSGLVLLTNDGELANQLMHPRYQVPKRYRVTVRGTISELRALRLEKDIAKIARRAAKEAAQEAGVIGPQARARPNSGRVSLNVLGSDSEKTVMEITTREGKVEAFRDALAILGHPIKKIERVAIGPLELKGLALGHWRELERHELRMLINDPNDRRGEAQRRKDRAARVAARLEREREAAKSVPDFMRRTDRIARAEQIRELRAERKRRFEERGTPIEGEISISSEPAQPAGQAPAPRTDRPAQPSAQPTAKPERPARSKPKRPPEIRAPKPGEARPTAPRVQSPLIRRAKRFQDDEQ
ncbi:MAG: pseudouridine synthase [Planctomycetota bacterium]|nr:pseudouridine synthase [Planctomycetota bacterium]